MATPEESAGTLEERSAARAPEAGVDLQENPRAFTLWQRLQIFLASWIGYLAVLLIGRTLRLEVYGWENWEAARKTGKGLIYTFWHREIFPATWFWRRRGIVVMTSQNFDGEYIARIIQRHGYGAARGSSSRGASRALGEMVRCLRHGADTAFTIDGPRGRYPVLSHRPAQGLCLPQDVGPDADSLSFRPRGSVHRSAHPGFAGS
jgi:hypothetical protein